MLKESTFPWRVLLRPPLYHAPLPMLLAVVATKGKKSSTVVFSTLSMYMRWVPEVAVGVSRFMLHTKCFHAEGACEGHSPVKPKADLEVPIHTSNSKTDSVPLLPTTTLSFGAPLLKSNILSHSEPRTSTLNHNAKETPSLWAEKS